MALIGQVNTIEAHYQNALRGGRHCVALGGDNVIWVVYGHWDNPDNGILAAYSIDGGITWTEEVVTIEAIYPWDGISLVISSDNVPHIIYSHWTGAVIIIRYISRVGGVWGAPETVFDTGFAAGLWIIKAVIDSADNIHIIYERTNLLYIVGVSGSWSVPEVADVNGTRPDLAINNSDEPVIVFVSGAPVGIHVRYRTGGVWTAVDTVDVTNGLPPSPIIQIDAADDYHVAWQNEELLAPWNYEIYYRKKETGVWLARQELVSDVAEWYVGLGLDDEDNAYVFYQYQGADEAVYYRKVTNGIVLGAQIAIDAGILRPNNDPSTFTFLYHKYPAAGVLAAAFQPVVVLLDEVPIGFPYADVNFYAAAALTFPPIAQTLPATGIVIA